MADYIITVTAPDGSAKTYTRAGSPEGILALARGYRDLIDAKLVQQRASVATLTEQLAAAQADLTATEAERLTVEAEVSSLEEFVRG